MIPPQAASSTVSAPPCALGETDVQWAKHVQTLEPDLRTHLHRKFPTLNREVDDIVQDTVLKAWKARIAGTLHSIRGFLYVTAEHKAFDLFRHNSVLKIEAMTENHHSTVVSDRPNAAESAARLDDLQVLKAVLAELPDGCRRVLILHRLHGLSHKEIAQQLHITEHTVEKHMYQAMQRCFKIIRQKRIQWP